MDAMKIFMDEVSKISGLTIQPGIGNRPASRVITGSGAGARMTPAGPPTGPSSPPDIHQQNAARMRARTGFGGGIPFPSH